MENCDEVASILWRIFDCGSELRFDGVRGMDYWKLYSMYDIDVNLVNNQMNSNFSTRCFMTTSLKLTAMKKKTDFH